MAPVTETFFIATPLGFETECAQELREVWPFLLNKQAMPHALPVPEARLTKGGLEIETELFAAVQLNFFLKTANRILWRMKSFNAHDLQKFFSQIQKIRVAEILGSKNFGLKVAASGSRLNNERKLKELAQKAWGIKEADEEDPAVYIRMDRDRCTVSLDTTGAHLHKRGTLTHRGEAPLRETIAAFTLRKMIGATPPGRLREIMLADPMCGSGTYLVEGADLWRGSFARTYRFQAWPSLPKLFQQKSFAANYKHLQGEPFAGYVGSDLSEKMVAAATKNVGARAGFEWRVQDLAQVPENFYGERAHWIVANPPYGERLAVRDLHALFHAFFRTRPERVGVLWTPECWRGLEEAPAGYVWTESVSLSNGGLHTVFKVAEKKNGDGSRL